MLLTKSRYMNGLRCKRHLWMEINQKDKLPEYNETTLYIMNQGNIVGNIAQKLFPDGIQIPNSVKDFKMNIEKTKNLLENKKTIFEAGIISNNLYARADIIKPIEDKWDIIEVKSSTKIKPEHIEDVAFQKYVYKKSGLSIRKCFIIHINKNYSKKGDINLNDLFLKTDITEEVNKIKNVEENIEEMFEVIRNKTPPETKIYENCKNGLECLIPECYNFLPKNNVYELYRGKKLAEELCKKRIFSMKDIPEGTKLTKNQKIQKLCIEKEKDFVNEKEIKNFISKLEHPIHYVDFETVGTAIPIYENTKPYQNIPFQFSLFLDEKFHTFLNDSKQDPRKDFLEALIKFSKDKGSVVVFYKPFESRILKELGETFPEYKKWIDSFISRMVDLIIPFREFSFYSTKQKGSCSIKNVLPALTDKSYSNMNINNGNLAAVKYFEMVFENKNKEKIKQDLLNYCNMDSKSMYDIIEKLKTI